MKIALFERNGETCVGKLSENGNCIQRFDLSLKELESLGIITLIGNDPPLLTEEIPIDDVWDESDKDIPEDYVICTGSTHTIREFLDVAFKHIDIEDWSEYVVQDPEFYRPAEVDYLRGDCSKAKIKLGWTPSHSFEDLVEMMVEHDCET